MTLSRLLYIIALYLLTPVILLRLLFRAIKAPAYRRRWGERFGFVGGVSGDNIIWLHAVSVGETLAAVPLVKVLQEQYPQHRLMLTCMTPTGSERITAAFGDRVHHSYAPYDMPDAVARFLNRVQPKILIIMETELWPNTIAACAARNIPVVVANARLSAKSAGGYGKIASLAAPMLRAINAIGAQHRDDGQRFTDLGLPASALTVTGNIKFDLCLDQSIKDKATELSAQWRGTALTPRPIILASSTHRGEDEIILRAFAMVRAASDSQPLLVLVPRHPERFDAVAELCAEAGLIVARRSANQPTSDADILVGDTMGELMAFYGACDLTFVGGSLVPTGGHNMIEPAAWGVPILTGPHLFNFAEASQLLLAADAMQVCDSAETLAEQMIKLLQNPQRRDAMGKSARQIAEANRGALEKLMAVIKPLLGND
jgi:3-deoxy-D-manno-octulosonic-acid transferase